MSEKDFDVDEQICRLTEVIKDLVEHYKVPKRIVIDDFEYTINKERKTNEPN